MSYQSVSVEMTQELFERSIKGSPKEAIKELIWNACDADAKNIQIEFEFGGFTGAEVVTDVYIKDDGNGIPFDKVAEYFGQYGKSLKTYNNKSPAGRVYHGKLGQGRYKSFSIGNPISWSTTYIADDGKYYSYEILVHANNQRDVHFSETQIVSTEAKTGTVVHIYGILVEKENSIYRLSENAETIPEMLSTFAPYLLAYNDINITYNNITLKPEAHIEDRREEIFTYTKETMSVEAKAIAIRWTESKFNNLYICGNTGVVFDEESRKSLADHNVSIYILSPLFEKMHKQNTLQMGNADPVYEYFMNQVQEFIKGFINSNDTNVAADEILSIKNQGVYPFSDAPKDEIEKAQQNTFDVLAVQVNRAVPQLKNSNRQTKKLTYRLIKEAINTNPSSIQTILSEVFNLTKDQQDDLAELLQRTHLPEIIDTAKTISDRLVFIYLLEQMVYNDSIGKPIKERTQFHKLLLNELWIFGEKYFLGTSDQSLKNLLLEHIKYLGREKLIPDIPPEAIEDLTRIPDICLFKQGCNGYESYEHLVIELKRPTLTLTLKELDQIQDYALKVAKNPLFDKNKTKWHFILLGQSFNEDVIQRLENTVVGEGNFYNANNISISVLKWSTVIQNNKLKYEFLKQKLNHQLSDDPDFAMDYLISKHSELFATN